LVVVALVTEFYVDTYEEKDVIFLDWRLCEAVKTVLQYLSLAPFVPFECGIGLDA